MKTENELELFKNIQRRNHQIRKILKIGDLRQLWIALTYSHYFDEIFRVRVWHIVHFQSM